MPALYGSTLYVARALNRRRKSARPGGGRALPRGPLARLFPGQGIVRAEEWSDLQDEADVQLDRSIGCLQHTLANAMLRLRHVFA